MKFPEVVKVLTPEPKPGRSDGSFHFGSRKGAVGSAEMFVAVTDVWP
jgi:hypothetical protein